MNRPDRRSRGFVLVNALVLAAALAAAATLLLARAETSRARLLAGQEAAQVALGLDAFDALAITLLFRNSSPGSNAAWASPLPPLALARGEVSGQIRDLQGRFNVNWLADPDNAAAHAAFPRLLRQLALPPQAGAAIRSFLQPGGPRDRAAWARLEPPLDPVGGAILSTAQLEGIPGLSARSLARLAPQITALPGGSRLNVNSAPRSVLAAFLPHLPPAALDRLLRQRRAAPFASPEAFLAAAGIAAADDGKDPGPEEAPPLLEPGFLTISSNWFSAESEFRLQGRASGHRKTVLRRRGLRRPPEVVWRHTVRP